MLNSKTKTISTCVTTTYVVRWGGVNSFVWYWWWGLLRRLFKGNVKKNFFVFELFLRFFFLLELYEIYICENCELFCLFEWGFLLSLTLGIFQNLIEILMVEFVVIHLKVLNLNVITIFKDYNFYTIFVSVFDEGFELHVQSLEPIVFWLFLFFKSMKNII